MNYTQQELLESIKELKTICTNLQIANADLEQRVYFLESYTGLGNGVMKPVLSPLGVEKAKFEYAMTGRDEMVKNLMQTKFKSNLLNNIV